MTKVIQEQNLRRITEGDRNPGGKEGTLLMANGERSPENENKGDR